MTLVHAPFEQLWLLRQSVINFGAVESLHEELEVPGLLQV